MSAAFDPYHKWLGIPPEEQPASLYRLLGIRQFEADRDVIDSAADQRMTHLRTFQSGKHAALSQKLLNEISRARQRLLDPEEKAEYDAQLRGQPEPKSGSKSSQAKASAAAKSASPAGGAKQKTARWPENRAPATLDEFHECLAISGLMSAEESRQFLAQLPTGKQPSDPKALATELARAGKLTRYQAGAVLQGKLKFLSFGEYVIVEKLGQGGMGQVLKAEHRRMRRMVALKLMATASMKDRDAVRRFQREVHAAARLIHPNIVTAFDANEHEGVHFFVMEYVEGKDLGAVVKEKGPLPMKAALDYVLQAARGLAYAHTKGIVHRDIKPNNLLLDQDGTVKILDMGLARMDLGAEPGQELTNTGQVMGTIDYMAPEQAEDTHAADARADIYSLGCTLYRLLTGEVLYTGDTVIKKVLAHRSAAIPLIGHKRPDAPADVEAVFRKMIAKLPEERHQTMADVIADLERCLQIGAPPSQPSSGGQPAGDPHFTNLFTDIVARGGKKPAVASPSTATVSTGKTKTQTGSASDVTIDVARGDTDPNTFVSMQAAGGAVDSTSGLSLPRLTLSKRFPLPLIIGAAVAGVLAIIIASVLLLRPTKPVTKQIAEDAAKTQVEKTPAKAQPAVQSAGPQRYVLSMNGASNSALSSSVHPDVQGAVTIEGWFQSPASKPTASAHNLGSRDFGIKYTAQGQWLVQTRTSTGFEPSKPAASPVPADWIHVAGVLENGEQRLYLNGELAAQMTLRAAPESNSNTAPMFIVTGTDNAYVAGLFAEIRYSNVARYREDFIPAASFTPDASTLALYHCDEARGDLLFDSSGNFLHATITGAQRIKAGGPPTLEPNAPSQSTAAPPTAGQASQSEASWVSLFNGQSLTGWWGIDKPELPAGWTVQNGAIQASGNRTHIATSEEYGDFELEVEWRIEPGANGGIFYRWGGETAGGFLTAPEYQICDNRGHPNGQVPETSCASAFGLIAPTRDATRPPPQWNFTRIAVSGNHVEHWLNGERVLQYDLHSDDWNRRVAASKKATQPAYGRAAKGKIALQAIDKKVWYRNLRVRPLTGAANSAATTSGQVSQPVSALQQLQSSLLFSSRVKSLVFQPPVNLGPGINTEAHEIGPTVTADELILIFSRNERLWESRRSSTSVEFGKAVQLAAPVNDGTMAKTPAVSGDGLTLIFASDRPGGIGGEDLWMTERKSLDDPFGKPVNLGPPVNTPGSERAPWLSLDGLTLIVSTPGPSYQHRVQYHRRARSAKFADGQPLGAGIDTAGQWNAGAALSPDESLLIYAVAANDAGGNARQDLYLSRRKWPSEPFPPGERLPAPINSGVSDYHPTWSADGFRLYFHSGRTGNSELFVADMSPLAELDTEPAPPANPDGADLALEFDGQGRAEIPSLSLDLSKPFTIEAYITQTGVVELPEGQWASAIYSMNRVGITNGYVWGMRLIGQHDQQLDHILERPTIVNGKKTHLAAVSTGQELSLFVDGQLAVKKDVKSNPPAEIQTSLEMGYAFRGLIDELRVSSIARYAADFAPAARFEPDASTLGLYHCDEGGGSVLEDSSTHGNHGKVAGAKWIRADKPIAAK